MPNRYGGRENLEAIDFLREHERRVVGDAARARSRSPRNRTAWPGVSRPVDEGGLGFGYKWNMGWMHDTLRYIEQRPDPPPLPPRRPDLRPALCLHRELHAAAVSHDEVVHGKGSLLGKMPGDRWQKFANLRAYFGFMWAHPGKKLLFMGGEIAPGARVEPRRARSTGSCWTTPLHAACSGWCATSTPLYRRDPGAAPARRRAGRLPVDRRRRRAQTASSPICAAAAAERSAGAGRLQLHAGAAARLPHRRARPAAPGSEVVNTDAAVYGGANVGNGGAVADRADGGARPSRSRCR